MRNPARMLAAVLACTVIAVACADAGEGDAGNEVLVLESPANQPRLATQGQSCGAIGCVQGLYCSRGVCCDKPCTEACWSCLPSEKADGLANGICGPMKVDKKAVGACYPHGEFPAQACVSEFCNGYGVCAKHADAPCPTECYGDSLVQPECGTSGQCTTGTISTCGHYSCNVDSCFTNCDPDDDSKCAAGNWCRDGVCIPPQINGKGCSKNENCTSGFCVDKVCCSSACDTPCHSCLAAEKSSGPTGECGEVIAGSDPGDRCKPDALEPCGLSGVCDASGSCALAPEFKPCGGASSCAPAAVPGDTSKVTGLLCDGKGACQNTITTEACTGYVLCTTDGKCPTSCTATAQCAAGFSCYDADGNPSNKECAPKIEQGDNCTADDQCVTNHCYDNTCCNAVCDDACQNCSTGTCELTKGEPVGNDGTEPKSCPGSAPTDPCFARQCDGLSSKCDGYVGKEVSCGTASCKDGVRTLAGSCDGKGHCNQIAPVPCGGFACDGIECKTTCASNDDCASGYVCDTTTGKCANGSYCSSQLALTDLDGTITSCAPYRCVGGACLDGCTSNEQCAAGYLCDHAKANCVVPIAGDDVDPPSCLCGMTRARDPSGLWLFGAALGMTLARGRFRLR